MKTEISSNKSYIKIEGEPESKTYFLMDARLNNGTYEFILERKEKFYLAINGSTPSKKRIIREFRDQNQAFTYWYNNYADDDTKKFVDDYGFLFKKLSNE